MGATRLLLTLAAGTLMAGSASAATYYGYTASPAGTASGGALVARNQFAAALTRTGVDDLERFSVGAAAPLTLQFNGGMTGTSAVLTGNGSVQTPIAGTFATSGIKDLISFGGLSVTFSNPVDAFGFYVSDVADRGASLKVRYNTGATTNYVISNSDPRPDGSLMFFGVIADAPIVSVTFTGSATWDGVGYDDFIVGSTAAVPEPASWALMIAGFALIGGAARRRSARTVIA